MTASTQSSSVVIPQVRRN